MTNHDHLDRGSLIRLLRRRDSERQLGLVWERDEIEADAAVNSDYVALQLDPALSHGDAPWDNLVIEGDNFDALRALRMSHKGAIRCIYIDPPYNTGNRDFVYDRELYARLLERFVAAVEASGAEVPDDEEERMQQLDLVLVRRPSLLRDAYRSMRRDHVQDIDVPVPAELHSDLRLRTANPALYGVFPPGLNGDELAIAELLDASPVVRWWHRNTPPRGLGLYRWDDGAGFYPDFVVCVEGRPGSGIALLEPKGEHLWGKDSEVEKSTAVHPDHGRVFMVGRKRGERTFVFLRELGGKLQSDGAFSPDRLRFT